MHVTRETCCIDSGGVNMFSKFHMICMLLFVGLLELPSVVTFTNEEHEAHELLSADWDVRCKLQPNSWKCYHNHTVSYKFYYDVTIQGCKTFEYGGCDLNMNSFDSITDCYSLCHAVEALTPEKLKEFSTEVICRLQHEFGFCDSYQPSFYYDISTRTCKGFSYSGCGGNGNRFGSSHECMEFCESIMPKYKPVRP